MTLLPKVKLKAMVSFPASIRDGAGIDIVRENGTYQFDLDFSDFAPPVTGVSDPAHANALLWNDLTNSYSLVPLSILGGGGGVPEADNDGQIYGRQNLGWTPIEGSVGADGAPGEKWFTGAIDPTTVVGAIDGDWFLNSVSGDFFDLVIGIWTLRGNLRGPEGPPGTSGTGTGNVSGPTPPVIDGDIAVWNGTTGTVIRDGAKKISDLALASHTHTASGITFTPAGTVAATDVQAAIAELDSEKLALTGGTMTGPLAGTQGAFTVPAASTSGYGLFGSIIGSPAAQGGVAGTNGTQFTILAPPGLAFKATGDAEVTGVLTVGGAPTLNAHAATKKYVDDRALTASAAISFTAIAAGAMLDRTISVTGAAVGDATALSVPTALNTGIIVFPLIGATDTVTLRFYNSTGGPLTPTNKTCRATVFKP